MKRSKISMLPKEIVAWLEKAISEKNFGAYEQITAEANKQLQALGYKMTLSKSGVHRYGEKLELKLQAIKDGTAAMRLIAEECRDDPDLRSSALTALTQTELFNIIVAIRELTDETDLLKRAKLLSALTGNISKLARSSVYQKKHEIDLRAKAQSAADAVAKLARKGGMSKALETEMRNRILGIAT